MAEARDVWIVILAGGVGSRFWPASTRARPKQLLPLAGNAPLIRETIDRVRPAIAFDRLRVVTGRHLAGPTLAAVPGLLPDHLMLEPRARGTAPALVWAAHAIAREDPDAVLVSLHADHVIRPAEPFRRLLSGLAARAAREDLLFTIGAVPDRPETGYGYIRPARRIEGEPAVMAVAEFVEKPDAETAARYVADGFLWNTGLFVWRAEVLLAEVERHTPEIAGHLGRLDAGDVAGFFEHVPALNIDPAVLERSDRVAVAPATFEWDDVGTWDAAARLGTADSAGNVLTGDAHAPDSMDCTVWTDGGPVVVYGARDLLVVGGGRRAFGAPRARAADIKALLERLPDRLRDPE